MAAVGVQILAAGLILLVIFGPPGQISTIIGLATAGLTVVLRDFIISFLGWFALMGKNGVRAGDWVEINGVSGEVIEIGLLKTVLLELGNWTDIAGTYRPLGGVFEQFLRWRGITSNFSTFEGQWLWDELEVNLPAAGDPYPMAGEIRKRWWSRRWCRLRASRRGLGARHQAIRRASFSAKPAVNLRPTATGLEVVVRYITRAPQRNAMKSKLFQVDPWICCTSRGWGPGCGGSNPMCPASYSSR